MYIKCLLVFTNKFVVVLLGIRTCLFVGVTLETMGDDWLLKRAHSTVYMDATHIYSCINEDTFNLNQWD